MRNNNRIIVIFLAFAGLVLCMGVAAQAARPVCIIKSAGTTFTSPNTETPCTTNKTAYDGVKTLVDFNSGCTGGTYEMDVVFEMGTPAEKLVSFQTSVKFNPTELVTPTCTVDPEDYFSDELVTPECPATNGADKYMYGAQANLFGDKWPSTNPNFRLMKIAFASLGFVEGATSTITFYGTIPSRVTRVTNADTTVSDSTPDADVICSTPPEFVKSPTSPTVSEVPAPSPQCTPTSGTGNVTISFTKPTQCEDAGGSTIACTVCTSLGVKVEKTSPAPAETITTGTTNSSVTTTCTIDGTTTPYVYSLTGVCLAGGASASDPVTVTLAKCQCGEAPAMSNVKINGQAYAEDITSGGAFSFLEGQPITLSGNVTDNDSDYNEITVTLYYETATAGARQAAAAQSVTATMASDKSFTVQIPGSAVSSDLNLFWGLTVEDELNLEGTPIPAGVDPDDLPNTGGSIDNDTVQKGTKLDFVRMPYPNQYPFRAGGQRLVIDFALNESANITTRIYTADGTLVRQIDNSTLDPEDNDNVCYWEKGCSWDGTSYLGGNNYTANGLYIVNISAVGTGQSFGGQTLSYTKGIVVMK